MVGLRSHHNYQTVIISCRNCLTDIFKYKKKNGTKSSLVKMFVDRITKDIHKLLDTKDIGISTLTCPKCGVLWGRHGNIAGNKIFKCIGGKLHLR